MGAASGKHRSIDVSHTYATCVLAPEIPFVCVLHLCPYVSAGMCRTFGIERRPRCRRRWLSERRYEVSSKQYVRICANGMRLLREIVGCDVREN